MKHSGNHAITSEPDAELAAGIATRVLGCAPTAIRKFRAGTRHHVFDVAFADRPPVVVRIGDRTARAEMAGAIHLSRLLRPQGVPLPAILAADARAPLPWLVLERLPGSDLGNVISDLAEDRLEAIAAKVARAQAVTATTRSAGRYGYAALPERAPHTRWSQVLDANLARSRERMAAAGLFDVSLVEIVQAEVDSCRAEIDAIGAIPFLHDTTTRNVIVTADGNFSGIVDVDDLCFGDPRYPAALALAVLMAYGGPASYVSAWLRHANHSDDRVFRIYLGLFLLDLMSEHGQLFNGNQRPSTPDRREALRSAFESNIALLWHGSSHS
jgi:aminoglycoside phosphotransferase